MADEVGRKSRDDPVGGMSMGEDSAELMNGESVCAVKN